MKIFAKVIAIILIILEICMLRVYASQATYDQKLIPAMQTRNNGINNFPDSYKVLLEKLQAKGYKNWKFVAFYTDIDWNELVENESVHLKNTIECSSTTIYPSSWYCECGKQGDKNYYCASKDIIKYYLDPRNFLTEVTIFEFLDLSNNSDIPVSKIEALVKNTFLDGDVNGIRYAKMIKDASNESGESPYSIVIKIFQELGKHPKGEIPEIISGKNSKYPNTYNFFNYGASDGEGNVERAYIYARDRGWNSAYKALVEGAKLMTSNYLKAGQTTKYTYKFDVVGTLYSELFKKQYMTNVQDPTNQSSMLYDAYNQNGYLKDELTFIIPIYKNMPTYVKLPSTQIGNLYYISSNYTSVYLRTGPGDTSSGYLNIAALPKDTLVNVIKTGIGGYAQVEVDGIPGYISEKYLTKVNTKKDTYKVPSISDLPFYDVDADSWYYSAVKYNYDKGMIKGLNDIIFAPEQKLTRAMLVTILYRMEKYPKVTATSKFMDVKDKNEWYYKAVVWATEKGIVHGYENGNFGANDNITREQLAVILNHYAKYKGKNYTKTTDISNFKDSSKVSSWALSQVKWAVASKVITGNENGTLNPTGTATRAEAASMLYKYCMKVK